MEVAKCEAKCEETTRDNSCRSLAVNCAKIKNISERTVTQTTFGNVKTVFSKICEMSSKFGQPQRERDWICSEKQNQKKNKTKQRTNKTTHKKIEVTFLGKWSLVMVRIPRWWFPVESSERIIFQWNPWISCETCLNPQGNNSWISLLKSADFNYVRVSHKHKSLRSFVLFNFIYANAFLQLNLCVVPMRACL